MVVCAIEKLDEHREGGVFRRGDAAGAEPRFRQAHARCIDDRPHLFDSCRQRREGFETPGGRVGDEGGQGGLSGSWRPVEDHRGGAGALDKSTQR